MKAVERLAGVGAALAGGGEPREVLRVAWGELRAMVAPRDVCLEARVAGRLETFGRRGGRLGNEVFALGGRGAAAGALVVGPLVGERERPLAVGEREALQVAAVLVGLFVENVALANQVTVGRVAAEGPAADGVAADREVDVLTGCLTRGEGMERIGAELRRACTRRCGASLIFVDVDHLKRLNDRYGHGFGDAALAAVGAALKDGLRGADVRCRYGGDEFVVLLPDTSCEGAVRVAEKLRRALGERAVDAPDGARVVAASFGVSEAAADEDDAGALVRRADAAMYRAKRAGGDAVRVWRDEAE